MTLKHTTTQPMPSGPSNELFTAPPSVPWKPHKYQLKAVKWLVEHAGAALFQDPGLGKTSETLAALKFLLDKKQIERVLLIAPLRVAHSVWPRELKKWRNFEHIKHVVLHGPKKDELLETEASIYVINPDGLPWLLGAEDKAVDMKRWRSLKFDTLVVDELSKFKDSSTKRFKLIRQIIPTFARRWGLTGSPSPNGLIDLFGQIYVVDEGRSLGRFVTHYRNKYFVQSWNGYDWEPQKGAEQAIYEHIEPVVMTMKAEDYIQMPACLENRIAVQLPANARRVYDLLEDSLLASVKEGTISAANAAVASLKCLQVACGGVYLDKDLMAQVNEKTRKELVKASRGRPRVNLHDEKTEAVAELVEELQGEPLLIAYAYDHDLERLKARLGENTPHIGGGISSKQALDLEARWNAGKLPVLLGHPQSLAHGLNLQGAGRHVCWHSLTWNFELYDQFNRRVWRQGQKSSRVFIHHIVAEKTVDELVVKTLKAKDKGQRALFAALKALSSTRTRR